MDKPYFSRKTKSYFIEHIKRSNSVKMQTRHAHEDYEIYYLMNGDRNVFVHDRAFNLVQGNILVISPNVIHRTIDGHSDYHERFIVELKKSYFNKYLSSTLINQLFSNLKNPYHIFELDAPECKEIENLFMGMINNHNSGQSEIPYIIFFMELLNFLNRLDMSKKRNNDFAHPSTNHERISNIIQYINKNYSKDIGLETTATMCFISPEHLSRSFKKITGFTFNEYLNNLRIHEAKKLLMITEKSISDIALTVGYQSNTHFGRIFKTKQGMSPSQFRKKVANHQ